MSESKEFNPFSYKTYDSLPEDRKREYVRVPADGFVKKKAKDTYEGFREKAKIHNRQRSFKNKLLGRGKVDSVDLIHEEALVEDLAIEKRKMAGLRSEERFADPWKQYRENLEALENGTFPVKKGGLVYRVVGGIKIGGNRLPKLGDLIEEAHATPHPECIEAIIAYNDEHQSYFDGMPFDNKQKIAVIEVESFEIPEPDITYNAATDRDQVLVKGEVVGILDPKDFFEKYIKTE